MTLTIPQLAERLGVHPTTVRRWITDAEIAGPMVHPATETRVYDEDSASEIERWYMEKVAEEGSRGPGAAERTRRAQEFLGEPDEHGGEHPVSPAQIVTLAAKKWLELGDDYFPAALLVVAAANKLGDAPVWLIIVAPPSSGKTELLMALASRPDAKILSKITPNTFASGMLKENASLLERLKERDQWLVALKDFGTMSSLPFDQQAQIYAQLREIYDGVFNATWGTGKEINWSGRIAVMAAATTAVDRGRALRTNLGERFIQFRPAAAPASRVAQKAKLVAMTPTGEVDMKEGLRAAYARAFDLTLSRGREARGETEESLRLTLVVDAIVELLAEARREVYRSGGPYSGSFEVAPAEGPARLQKIFAGLSRAALACFGPRPEAALHLLLRFALDSITPGQRGKLLMALATHEAGVTVAHAARSLSCDDNTARRHLDDLVHIGLARSETIGGTAIYVASGKFSDLAARIYLDEYEPSEALRKLSDRPTILPLERERETSVSSAATEDTAAATGIPAEGEGE